MTLFYLQGRGARVGPVGNAVDVYFVVGAPSTE